VKTGRCASSASSRRNARAGEDHVVHRERHVEAEQTAAMVEQRADRHRFLAGARETRPIERDGGVVVELAAVGEHRERHRREALRHGEDHGARVACPRRAAFDVRHAAPQIDHAKAVLIDAQARADLFARGELRTWCRP
jgi:hypothetical protein